MKIRYKKIQKKEYDDFLKASLKSELQDFTDSDPWRVLRIQSEIVEGFEALSKIGPCVSIFGSARTLKNNRYYKAARETARLLSENGLGVIRTCHLKHIKGQIFLDMKQKQLAHFLEAENFIG